MRFFALIALFLSLAIPACAEPTQLAGLPDRDTPGESSRLLDEVRKTMAQGRGEMEANKPVAIETLRNAAQKALANLVAFVGPQILTASLEDIPTAGIFGAAARQTAEAHYWWGRAADQFGQRDEAVTAFARAIRFAGRVREGNTVAVDARYHMGGVLRDGLPQLAPDDALETISKIAHENLWEPKRFTTDFSNLNLDARQQEETDPTKARWKHEFLITSGRLFPPVPAGQADPASALTRVPPLYRKVDSDALPDVLKLDSLVLGYEKVATGPNKGLWKQVVRIYYPSVNLTKASRDDRPRAEALCGQFLKVHALMQTALNLDNAYVKDGVTTLWLSEVSSLWPRDDEDTRIRIALGAAMPKINVHVDGQQEPTEIESPPTSYPWRAAGQMDAAPGDIMFFKMDFPRDEAEWLRETLHEYGHVVVPAFDNYKPPLEPYANGLLGETLGMLWVASDPSVWGVPSELASPVMDNATLPSAVRSHVKTQALAALKFWRGKGLVSPLRKDTGTDGLRYLQGFVVYTERVYGAPILSQIFAPLAQLGTSTSAMDRMKVLNADSFLTAFPSTVNDALGTTVRGTEVRLVLGGGAKKTLPVWLGGALEINDQNENDLISRAPVRLKAGEKVSGWLFVPAGATSLRVEWQSNSRSPEVLQVDGFKDTVTAPLSPDASSALQLDVKSRAGWQRFTFSAKTDATILLSQFEN